MSYQEEKLRQPIVTPGVTTTGMSLSSTSKPVTTTTSRVTLTSAQLSALHTTTVVVAPAAGSGTIVVCEDASIEFVAVTTPYASTALAVFALKYTNGSGATATATVGSVGLIDQSTNQLRTMPAITSSITPVENAALVLYLDAQNPTTGDGTLVVQAKYRIETIV